MGLLDCVYTLDCSRCRKDCSYTVEGRKRTEYCNVLFFRAWNFGSRISRDGERSICSYGSIFAISNKSGIDSEKKNINKKGISLDVKFLFASLVIREHSAILSITLCTYLSLPQSKNVCSFGKVPSENLEYGHTCILRCMACKDHFHH